MSAVVQTKPVLADASRATERHYSVAEIGESWKLSKNKVREIFQNEPGVLTIGESRPKFGRRRGYVTLRIPQSVLDRVHRRLCKSQLIECGKAKT